MSILPNFKKNILPSSQRSHTSRYTDGTRVGSERCPYCGGWHSTDAEMDDCARRHSSVGSTYQCPRCGRYYATLDQANRCCDAQKRYERRYDPPTYAGYTSGYPNAEPEDHTDWYQQLAGSSQTTSSSGEGMFSGFFNFGGNNDEKPSDSSDGIFNSFFNAGGGNNKDKGSGGGFFG